ncbi:uncharacterized protein LOC124636417 [Helicoverpa zea]|uniref:uncharacterized protein LOC124636417 n=1 Tax=Helicoverpa zea TaxID=7113 RepID=UPI001F593907|nr:uncharacterized protein LOC124636417 [Helicoverpa zea]
MELSVFWWVMHPLGVSWCSNLGSKIRFSKIKLRIGTCRKNCENIKQKVASRNNLLRRLTSTTWGASPTVLRATGLALCYSAGEYACPVWSRSVHAGQVDVALNETCRIVTGCLKPTPLQMLHALAGIAPPDVRRSVASGIERAKLETDQRHPMHYYTPVPQRLKSRRGFYKTVAPVDGEARDLWRSRSSLPSPFVPLLERLPPGHDLPRRVWQSLNRLRTQVGRSKESIQVGLRGRDGPWVRVRGCSADNIPPNRMSTVP